MFLKEYLNGTQSELKPQKFSKKPKTKKSFKSYFVFISKKIIILNNIFEQN